MKVMFAAWILIYSAAALAQPSAAERRFIHEGMTEAEVVRLIGKPAHKSSGKKEAKGKQSGKVWIYYPHQDDPQTTTSITLANGQVTRVERRVTY
jgi:hypothetical protein